MRAVKYCIMLVSKKVIQLLSSYEIVELFLQSVFLNENLLTSAPGPLIH